MRNRYFSPEPTHLPTGLKSIAGSGMRLKGVGSSSRLGTATSMVLGEGERKVGHYSYEVGRCIGSGFSSKVYRGRCEREGRECAVKVIELRKHSESSLRMLDSEIQIIKTLDHPNVIRCFDVYRTSSHCYIVTEYCSGGDLGGWMNRRGRLSEAVARQVMGEIIEGVKYLLGKGILHRDLKPANILSNRRNWKIADFGFAMWSQGEVTTKYNVGTPLYMPLQALQSNTYSPLTDIFSLGIIYHEMLTGSTPWECKHQKELIRKMKTLPYVLPERFKVGPTTRSLLFKFCSIDPTLRLTKDELMQLRMGKYSQPDATKTQSTLTRSTSQAESILLKSTSNIDIGSSKSLLLDGSGNGSKITPSERPETGARVESRNNHILINQLHFCRFMYYFVRNLPLLPVTPTSRTKTGLAVYKHLQHLIKQLSDERRNWLGLKGWETFRQSKKYRSTIMTIKEYSQRYDKEYLNYLKRSELALIRQVNSAINEPPADALSSQFYKNLQAVLESPLREANHNLGLSVQASSDSFSADLKGAIEAVSSLAKYHRLLQMSIQHSGDHQWFEKHSQIRVQIDYRTASVTMEHYSQLRNDIKFL